MSPALGGSAWGRPGDAVDRCNRVHPCGRPTLGCNRTQIGCVLLSVSLIATGVITELGENENKVLDLLDQWREESTRHEPRERVELMCTNADALSVEANEALQLLEWWAGDRFPWLDVRLRMGDDD